MKRRDFLRYGAMGLVAVAAPAAAAEAVRRSTRAGSPEIVSCAIHPAIGVARVGNSPDGFFLGPELPGVHPRPEGGFKDGVGRLMRQAVRFRVYGLDADGVVVQELTAADAEITWTVHLANKKAGWYNFVQALDIPESAGESPAPGYPAAPPLRLPRRNADLRGEQRRQLVVDPGPRSIAGPGVNAGGDDRRYAFDTGSFFGQAVPLGELRTDDAGRLLVFGGFGTSRPATPGTSATTFANNDRWCDDTADGPVEATVRLGDRVMRATGAWAVVAPPNYAPEIHSVVTLYDLIFEVATRLEPARAPGRPSFARQIYPLFERLVRHQWVNDGFAREFGWGTAGDLLAPATLAGLADRSDAARPAREALFRRFRDPAYTAMILREIPAYYGDAIALPAVSPRQYMAVLAMQYGWMRRWAAGDFDADWPAGGMRPARDLVEIPLADRPGALDRAALDECLGGPFHPGCELTWPMRLTSLYDAPFRLRRRAGPEPDWGDEITSAVALAPAGPLTASGPGDLTRWMAVPWQTDTASCLSAYEPELDAYLPTFWPARVPNDILTDADYRIVLDRAAPAGTRAAAFARRTKWLRQPTLRGADDLPFINAFIRDWYRYGVIGRRPGPDGDPAFPADFWVEEGFAGPLPGGHAPTRSSSARPGEA